MSEHLDRLFSDAYDGNLDPAERQRFDDHLVGCPSCRGSFVHFNAAVDAVHELPPARMPHSVRLPAAAPSRAGGPSWSDRLAGWRRPLITLATVAAALVLVVAVTQNMRVGGGRPNAAVASPGSVLYPQAPAATASACLAGGCPGADAAAPKACAPEHLSIDAAAAARIPSGFNNAVVHRDGNGTLFLATPSLSYSPGETVLIYARYVEAPSGIVDLPCAGLGFVPGVTASSGARSAEGGVLQPAGLSESVGAGGPLYQVTIPQSAAAGATLEVVADIPGSASAAPSPPVSLILRVS